MSLGNGQKLETIEKGNKDNSVLDDGPSSVPKSGLDGFLHKRDPALTSLGNQRRFDRRLNGNVHTGADLQ